MLKKIKSNPRVETISEIMGWYGTVAVIGAFGLLTANIISTEDPIYQILNITGSVGIIFDAYMDGNTQPVVLNIIWAAIAIYGLVQIFV